MQLWQASGPWGPRRYSAFMYVAENGYLPKDWDWAASPLTVGFPSLPYLVSSSMGGICDLITRGAPPLPRTAPNFGDVQKVNPDADSSLRAAADLVDSPDQMHVSADIRAPPCCSEAAAAGFPTLGPGGCPDGGNSLGLPVGLVRGLAQFGLEVDRLSPPLQMKRKLRVFFSPPSSLQTLF